MTLLGMEGFKRSFEECKSQKQSGPNRSERGIRTGHFGPGTSIDNLRDPHDKKLKIRFINRNKGKKNEGKKKNIRANAIQIFISDSSIPPPPLPETPIPPPPSDEPPSPPPEPTFIPPPPSLPLDLPPDPDQVARDRHFARCCRHAFRIYQNRVQVEEFIETIGIIPKPRESPCPSPAISVIFLFWYYNNIY